MGFSAFALSARKETWADFCALRPERQRTCRGDASDSSLQHFDRKPYNCKFKKVMCVDRRRVPESRSGGCA
eukprot:CAMPEP_0174370220 /NCGR_PEP_ID=MMETSP0811_2-20130205/95341_1 /TAXON_ID=73025 ORGANISM="Eutreptiella gymnastica-like, Strain CCMP1594" /NCGR_SAMPLE_ID=MMETSP0811_2 /ASSEMBLY_ACC=CAM_ASM_000667 /LENGTH=70 /DNA_ID=CAMNT_0015515401 /DNA_START=373 /DNA_END=585 /DNA_ORIENTATION=+